MVADLIWSMAVLASGEWRDSNGRLPIRQADPLRESRMVQVPVEAGTHVSASAVDQLVQERSERAALFRREVRASGRLMGGNPATERTEHPLS